MPIVHQASAQEVARLLALFPAAHIKQVWPELPGRKTDVCRELAEQADARDQIVNFLKEHFTCCKQHAHVLERPNEQAYPAMLGDAERIHQVAGEGALYIARVRFSMFQTEPDFMQASLTFLWPFRLDVLPQHLV